MKYVTPPYLPTRRGPNRPPVSLIAAMAENRVIGREGGLPWRLPDDLRHFKQLTVDHTVIMGRKTFDEIKRPLDNRRNVVVTRNKEFRPHGVTVVPSLKEALALGATEDEVFVIGGGEIFKAALPLASRIYLTLVHARVEGDTFFPPFEEDAWVLSSEEFHPADERHQYSFTFRRYDRLTD
jgi:dihydrofolate reductase